MIGNERPCFDIAKRMVSTISFEDVPVNRLCMYVCPKHAEVLKAEGYKDEGEFNAFYIYCQYGQTEAMRLADKNATQFNWYRDRVRDQIDAPSGIERMGFTNRKPLP